MGVTGFFHAGVTVKDMDASLGFYRDGLGLEVAYLIDPDGYHVECYEKAPDAPDIVTTLQAS
jgi:catechol 2,3-dioxygenase-like lactoylglutathione lyase family enzyme